MDRREFITSAAALAVTGTGLSSRQVDLRGLGVFGAGAEPRPLTADVFAQVPPALQAEFDALLLWMRDAGWTAYLERVARVNLDPSNPGLLAVLAGPATIASPAAEGFGDFGGDCVLQAGAPARSLLYHALASPLVKLRDADGTPAAPDRYPELHQLDALENYIHALHTLDDRDLRRTDWVLAVFAYEYRPAIKTPHRAHADFVYSRTGIARVGNRPMVYDREHRCHVNRANGAGATEKDLAVTPARYGLFLARPVAADDVGLIGTDRQDGKRKFLVPFRKVFAGDRYVGGGRPVYAESHRNEKLLRLTHGEGIELPKGNVFDVNRPPFIRTSCTATDPAYPFAARAHDSVLAVLTPSGAGVLVSSPPDDLVRPALQDTKRLRFRVPPEKAKLLAFSNRRYTTLKLSDSPGLDLMDLHRQQYRAPRNTPMFVNIRYRVRDDGSIQHLDPTVPGFERIIERGTYWAALFEDSLCDGCVHAVVAGAAPAGAEMPEGRFARAVLAAPVLPAFSVVTAPDFFPMVDGDDLKSFAGHFQAGGPEVLSAGRQRANPHVRLPGSSASAFPAKPLPAHAPHAGTMTAVVSHPLIPGKKPGAAGARPYTGLNTLPDTASNVFFPGWDVTYSGEPDAGNGVYYATFGLGSPFPEDTKLCAAANGMWPGSSPDAARTFQGALEPLPVVNVRTPTAVPLLDEELGFHPRSPAVHQHGRPPSRGWDGEQGPFIEVAPGTGPARLANPRRIVVNFTDIRRSDYVANAQRGGLDASVLREVSSAELIGRMDALRRCVRHLPGAGIVKGTQMWLVSAEKVDDWSAGARGLGIAAELFAGGTRWATASHLPERGGGYLYVFARTADRAKLIDEAGERMRDDCKVVYVCQVGRTHLAFTQFDGKTKGLPAWTVKNG